MDVFEAIRRRRSHRLFENRPVEPEKIDRIIEAACWAPSPANSQPWEFIIITSEASRKKLHDLAEESRRTGVVELHGFSYVRPLPYTGVEDEKTALDEALKRYSFSFLMQVPVIVAVVGLPQTIVRAESSERSHDGYKYACAAAIQNMLLAAQAQDIGSLWFTLFDQVLVSKFLNIEPSKHLVALVCLGYSKGEPRPPGRHQFSSKVRRFDR